MPVAAVVVHINQVERPTLEAKVVVAKEPLETAVTVIVVVLIDAVTLAVWDCTVIPVE
jgi:hypothetical protein